ncbi:phosphoglycerate mutase family protein [Emticicia fluvialis]|uniref:phosphoglycerate mutase family protein n=1 Tax=Emticicia fluvialis TaxID=2974474 RepID=UPI0021662F4B|nr:phosphoglycerate mutase family protein [Emticicia fluvialis]
MKNYFYLLFIVLFLSACQRSVQSTYYIVRHGEKADDTADPVLSAAGQERAETLKKLLADRKISAVYATSYQRTSLTAQPFADAMQLSIQKYDPRKQKPFIEDLKKIEGRNVLIVGHSNTVRHIANGLFEQDTLKKDLEETDFDNLYIVKRQTAPQKKLSFTAKTYGKPTP